MTWLSVWHDGVCSVVKCINMGFHIIDRPGCMEGYEGRCLQVAMWFWRQSVCVGCEE